jgi:hypothetical protein
MSSAPASLGTHLGAGLPPEVPSALGLGQIVKARVLKHYEGSRYLVSLEGRERVVDSSVPLKTGELIRGRVLALGDRVELQPVPEPAPGAQPAEAPPAAPRDELAAAFAQVGLKLDDTARAVVARALKASAEPEATLVAAMTLAKIGLPQDAALLDSVQALLTRRPAASRSSEDLPEAFALSAGAPLAPQLHEALRAALPSADANAAQLAAMPAQIPGAGEQQPTNSGGGGAGSDRSLGQRVMNTQTGGVVSHRVGTLPLLVGGRLVEVDVALFDQNARQPRPGESRSRHVVFVLDSAALGGIEVSARVVDSRLRIRFAAERGATLERLAAGREALARQLAELGWTVDELAYEPRQDDSHNAAYRAIADHVVAQGSLDRKV